MGRNKISIKAYFTKDKEDPFEKINWQKRTALITNERNEEIFKQENVEFPDFWSDTAVNITASKYFHGIMGTSKRENSLKQLITRVVETIARWGIETKYFDQRGADVFKRELSYILVNQMASFNSPVWFNLGVVGRKMQSAACFINKVQDSMESILDLVKIQGMLYKGGSGSGVNLSPLRSSFEKLSNGGTSSGPISFMRLLDSAAGVIKSGGAARRAAAISILGIDHPNIIEFIECKVKEEEKAQLLLQLGMDSSLSGEIYNSLMFQNANNTVRVTDKFMTAVKNDDDFETRYVTTGKVCKKYKAKKMLRKIAEATWKCGDPAIQFHDTINRYNTCANDFTINASNPCFTGDMRILTLDGYLSFDELIDKNLVKTEMVPTDKVVDVKILNGNKEFVDAKIVYTGKKECLQIWFIDKATPIQCTPDHVFKLVDGEQCQAKDLLGKKVKGHIRDFYMTEKIISIGEKDVYDFQEPATNWGIVEDCIVHNCSEFMWVDNSACNLASINLLRVADEKGNVDIEKFCHIIDMMILAQDILIDSSDYPTNEIATNSINYRPLGLGYMNLGALLMLKGLPYDSDQGRIIAALITSILTGEAYKMSGNIAKVKGSFKFYDRNIDSFREVLQEHKDSLISLRVEMYGGDYCDLKQSSLSIWNELINDNKLQFDGFRNPQVTVLAPTGTISMKLDAVTMGIEPEMSLIRFKKMVDGGVMRIANPMVPQALKNLGYSVENIKGVLAYLQEKGTLVDCPIFAFHQDHLRVFECSMKDHEKSKCIASEGHVKMMAAVQPFISGAISKTVNVPHETGIDEIVDIYIDAWEKGLKSISIYRDGSKFSQPITTGQETKKEVNKKVRRKKLPDERKSTTHRFTVGGQEGYLTVGTYEDGTPGEMFVVMSKQGGTLSGLMDCFATLVSIALQYGIPLQTLIDKFTNTRFEPAGFTGYSEIPMASSIMDYIFKWMNLKFIEKKNCDCEKSKEIDDGDDKIEPSKFSGLLCSRCGSIMVQSGMRCHKCPNCGDTTGCS